MSDLSLVRTLIGDKPRYCTAQSVGDGFTVEFVFTVAPIIAGTEKVYVAGGTALTTPGQYSVNADLGLFTLVTPPAQDAEVAITAQATMLTDSEINELLAQYDSDAPKLAAADALDIIASSEALIQKKMTIMDTQTDGAAVADSLRKHAKALRDQVLNKDFQEPSWDFAEQVLDTPGFVEKVFKDFQREAL